MNVSIYLSICLQTFYMNFGYQGHRVKSTSQEQKILGIAAASVCVITCICRLSAFD